MVMIHMKPSGSGDHAAQILRALPNWFGIAEANDHYQQFAENHPTFLAMVDDDAVGFLSIKQHAPESAEIYVMGVLPTYHRQGIGRQLVEAAEAHLRTTETRFLQVKTLSEKHPDVGYALTRSFYFSMGFVKLEEFPTLWGEHNPALMLIKHLPL